MELFYSIWKFLTLSAPYLLLGLLISGIIHEYLGVEFIKKNLKKNSLSNTIKAALIGIPLPLCSCSVIPTAITLKKAGASNASTSSFLVATPESGIDSMAMTWAVMDIPMTFLRPIVAFLSATITGILQILFNPHSPKLIGEKNCPKCPSSKKNAASLRNMFKYAFVDLIDDMSFWLLIGIILGGVIDLFLPSHVFQSLGTWDTRLFVLLAGTPVYICASAATPIAASLVLKGMSPGVALLFLMVGPATNISNLIILQKYINKRGVILNIIGITTVALIASFLVDFCYEYFAWPSTFKLAEHTHKEHSSTWWQQASAILLGFLMLKGLIYELKKKVMKKN